MMVLTGNSVSQPVPMPRPEELSDLISWKSLDDSSLYTSADLHSLAKSVPFNLILSRPTPRETF